MELGFVKDQLILNWYPVRDVDRGFAFYVLAVEVEEELEEEDKPNIGTIFSPFVPGFSEHFSKWMGGQELEVVFTKPVSLQSKLRIA